ncbi:NRDE family protein [Hydrogenophaga sp. RWCD_12]|uniref:NRDE family protein n=1 Tax=Hydrogenophaga sp. RWCD_12 TaxID=3391190 RepID=UPI003984AC79
MCLIAFAIGADPHCPLLLAANRDEFFERPTAPLHRWALPDGTAVFAGRDLRDGGTWLGVSEGGRVAMLTNVRSAHLGPGRRSRGELTTRWLSAGTDWTGLLAGIDPADYGGFNLVVGDISTGFWAWITNRNPAQPHAETAMPLYSQRLLPGVYGLSNAAMDTPWPKTEHLKAAMAKALGCVDTDRRMYHLTSALRSSDIASDEHLPSTGVPRDIEAALSSPFVDMVSRGYGTRSSSVIQIFPQSSSGLLQVFIDEWTHGCSEALPQRWGSQGHRRELATMRI